MKTVYRGIRRKVCLYLVDRIEISFPEDWDHDISTKEVVGKWLRAEGDRR
jgi:hypothetical protein